MPRLRRRPSSFSRLKYGGDKPVCRPSFPALTTPSHPPTPPAVAEETGEIIPTRLGPARVVHRAADLDPVAWRAAWARYSKDARYYEVCERALTRGFDYRYLELRDRSTGEIVAVQPFFLNDQDLTAGLSAALRAPVEAVRRAVWPRFLTMRMLMVGCTGGEAHLGTLTAPAPRAVTDALLEALDAYARKHGVAVLTFKDFAKEHRTELTGPAHAAGYVRIPSFPANLLHLEGLRSADDYLEQRLGKAMRKNLRRKFKAVATADPPVRMEVRSDVRDCVDELLPLYRQVLARSAFRFEELTREYFVGLSETMGDRARFFIWRQGGRAVAFSACLVHGGVLYDNYLGMDYAVALDLHLYFVTIRDLIGWSIGQGLRAYYSTPLNYDPKLHLRFDLEPLDLYVRHVRGFFNVFFRRLAPLLEPTRYDKLLPRFRNYPDLQG